MCKNKTVIFLEWFKIMRYIHICLYTTNKIKNSIAYLYFLH